MRKPIRKALDPHAKVRNRGSAVVPDSRAKDHEDHFPINDADQARNALARVSQLDAAPSWWGGSLAELQAAVRRAVARKFPGISVSMPKAQPRAVREIVDGAITHVSLCRRGMNKMPVLLKSDGRLRLDCLTKVDAKEGLLHALVYVPDRVDAEGDVASVQAVKNLAHDFLANGGNVDVEHDLQALGPDQVRVAETMIVQKGDPRFEGWTDYDGKPVDPAGSWGLILKLIDPDLRAAAERGEIGGVSMFGTAEVRAIGKSADDRLLDLVNTATTNTPSEDDMTPEQMNQLAETLVKALAAGRAPAAPAAPAANDIPFEGDPLSAEDIAKHMDKVMLARVNWQDPKSIAAYQGHVAKRQAEMKKAAPAAPADQALATAQAELKAAQERIAALQKASGAPVEGDPAPTPAGSTVLSKSEQDQFAAGRKAAKQFQGRK